MGFPVTIKVNFRGNVRKFPVADSEKAQWESVEAWIKTTIGLCHFQVKYFDEDNEEVSINSQEEYVEALKSALKQGNQLHMNVYKMKGQAEGGAMKVEVKELKLENRPAPPYPSRLKTVDKETQVTPERDSVVVKDNKGPKVEDEAVPAWFKSYMDKFKDQVVKEVVDKMCSEFSGQCCTHRGPGQRSEEPGTSGSQGPIISSTTGVTSSSSSPTCSSCKGPATGGGYQCSVCPSCILCEPCSQGHDPSHNLKRTRTPLSVPERGVTPEPRFPRRGDRTVRKAERQRLKAERRQLKAEVKEIKKKLRLEKRGLLWSGSTSSSTRPSVLALVPAAPALDPAPAPAPGPQATSPEGPKVSCSTLVPTMTALFLDENLPDGTCLEPGTKFIKYWKMHNTGNISWTSDTKLKFMWGNLAPESREQREVAVPFLQPGQVGVVSVAFVAPLLEGTYTSHWRLAHCGEQFGPRVWCSIVVVPGGTATACQLGARHHSKRPRDDLGHAEKEHLGWLATRSSKDTSSVGSQRPYYIPSVDMLTAQDLLSFELLDINIVQELDKVPANTPVDMTPCMSPLPHRGHLLDKPGVELTKDKPRPTGDKKHTGNYMVSTLKDSCWSGLVMQVVPPPDHLDPLGHDEADEDISGTQFVCETVIRSLTLEEPDHRPRRRARQGNTKPVVSCLERPLLLMSDRTQGPITKSIEIPPPHPQLTVLDEQVILERFVASEENLYTDPSETEREEEDEEEEKPPRDMCVEPERAEEEPEAEAGTGDWDEVSSQVSSVSSEDYTVILPDCFDTSRPLASSMYSSAVSQHGTASCLSVSAADPQPGPVSDAEPDARHLEGEVDRRGRDTGRLRGSSPIHSSVTHMLCASQTLDAPALVPEVVPAPGPIAPPVPPRHAQRLVPEREPDLIPRTGQRPNVLQRVDSTLNAPNPTHELSPGTESGPHSPRESSSKDLRCKEMTFKGYFLQVRHRGITDGLVKGALSVAASAYKALFTGQSSSTQRAVVAEDPACEAASMQAVLQEMGFCDTALNQRLLLKHRHNLLDVVNELVQLNDNEWYASRH
ncbi:NBR1 autophagy cargo receptor a isoform X1 [Alosa sapidissima]|uniref:NBR1 autophagy cargo receptor a isoform X1 n=1 Tax=Alosa sapidissima TaxID=34773 RepID=UPI001C08BCA5|nr:NBR1 autophagy cargo receptor a isoform X1 [Alosa sapidissima]